MVGFLFEWLAADCRLFLATSASPTKPVNISVGIFRLKGAKSSRAYQSLQLLVFELSVFATLQTHKVHMAVGGANFLIQHRPTVVCGIFPHDADFQKEVDGVVDRHFAHIISLIAYHVMQGVDAKRASHLKHFVQNGIAFGCLAHIVARDMAVELVDGLSFHL